MSEFWTRQLLGAAIGFPGVIFIWSATDWHLALGIMLLVWGNNIQRDNNAR